MRVVAGDKSTEEKRPEKGGERIHVGLTGKDGKDAGRGARQAWRSSQATECCVGARRDSAFTPSEMRRPGAFEQNADT